MKGSASAPVSKQLIFVDNHKLHEYEPVYPVGYKRAHHRVQSKTTGSCLYAVRKDNMAYYEAESHAKAAMLASVCGHAATTLWSVCWHGDWCWLFHPPEDGVVSADVFVKGAAYNYAIRTERDDGIRLIWDSWGKFVHHGKVPTRAETASTHPGRPMVDMPSYDIPYTHADGEDEH